MKYPNCHALQSILYLIYNLIIQRGIIFIYCIVHSLSIGFSKPVVILYTLNRSISTTISELGRLMLDCSFLSNILLFSSYNFYVSPEKRYDSRHSTYYPDNKTNSISIGIVDLTTDASTYDYS